MSQYFPKPCEPFGGNINVKVHLSNYATKTYLKNVSHVDVSCFALKSNLASLKTKVDKVDADKLKTVPVDLAKLSNVAKNDVVKTEYNKLVTKVDNIDTTNFVKKTIYEKDGSEFEDKINKIDEKIPDVVGLVKKTDFNTKVTDIDSKLPDVSSLVNKTDYATEIANIKNDYVTNAALNARHKDIIQTGLSQPGKVSDKRVFSTMVRESQGEFVSV